MISRDEVKKVAMLSRLTVTEAEIDKLQPQLSSILEFADSLSTLDLTGIEPTAHAVEVSNVFQDAERASQNGNNRCKLEDALQNAPERDGNLFLVPKVIG